VSPLIAIDFRTAFSPFAHNTHAIFALGIWFAGSHHEIVENYLQGPSASFSSETKLVGTFVAANLQPFSLVDLLVPTGPSMSQTVEIRAFSQRARPHILAYLSQFPQTPPNDGTLYGIEKVRRFDWQSPFSVHGSPVSTVLLLAIVQNSLA
jgi:hypothetical protein